MQKQYTIRIADEIFLKIKEISWKERRSFNAQVEKFLDEKVKEYELTNGKIKVNTDDLY